MTLKADTSPARLIPPFAIERMPKPVRDDQAKAADILRALEAEKQRRAEARQAAREAPEVDAEARAAAARKGTKLPGPTVATREHERQAAEDACDVLAADYDRAVTTLHRTILDNHDAVMEVLRKATATAAEEAEAAAYFEKLDELGRWAGLTAVIAELDEYRDHHRRGRLHPRVGKAHLDTPRRVEGVNIDQLAGDLDYAVGALAKPITETRGQEQEREARESESTRRSVRAWKQMARGGVHVPS